MQPVDFSAVVKKIASIPRESVTAGTETEMQVLVGPKDGASNFSMRRFIMGKSGGMPLHCNAVEHEQFVLNGSARVTVGNKIHDVKKGTVLFIPAGEPHAYEVVHAPFEFLCIVPNKKDSVTLVANNERN